MYVRVLLTYVLEQGQYKRKRWRKEGKKKKRENKKIRHLKLCPNVESIWPDF